MITFYIFKLNLPSNHSCHLSVAVLKYLPLNCNGVADSGNTRVEVLQNCTVSFQHCEQMNKSQLENIVSLFIYITQCLKLRYFKLSAASHDLHCNTYMIDKYIKNMTQKYTHQVEE